MEKINKKILAITGIVIICIFLIVTIINTNKNEEPTKKNISLKTNQEERIPKSQCMVDVKGHVKKTGLYKVDCNYRIQDVIVEAGGLEDNANTSIINLGKKVFDEMVLVIYSDEEVENFTETKEKENQLDDKCKNGNDACIEKEDRVEVSIKITEKENDSKIVSINTATKEELMTLKGVGESKAIAIIDYRNENGLFNSIEELKNVRGIGEKMFENIKNNITL